jgi:DNA-binding GntR family transcriptional regulator
MSEGAVSLADTAYATLLDLIITLKLKPGSIVSENETSKSLGIGRMPIRDAFRRLEAEGLVEILPKKGVLVSPIRTEELFLQLEVRSVIEALIVRRACKYATPAERRRILELAEGYEKATVEGDRLAAIRVDEEFHILLGRCGRNPFADKAISPFYAKFQRIYFSEFAPGDSHVLKNNYSHIRLMRAIAEQNADSAIQALRELLGNLKDYLGNDMSTWLPDPEIDSF